MLVDITGINATRQRPTTATIHAMPPGHHHCSCTTNLRSPYRQISYVFCFFWIPSASLFTHSICALHCSRESVAHACCTVQGRRSVR